MRLAFDQLSRWPPPLLFDGAAPPQHKLDLTLAAQVVIPVH